MSESNGYTDSQIPRFKSKLARMEIIIEDKNGIEQKCYLEELESDKKDDWVNLSLERSKYNDAGVRVGYNVKDLEANLVHKCLHKEDGTSFGFREIQTLPASTVTGIYKLCEDLNGLSEKARQAVKNA